MRVLLVEDDRMIGEAVEAALVDAAYAPDWVRDGQSAIEAVAAQTYDIVLLDLGLPKTDGIQVLRTIRGRNNAVPVLIITARDAVESRIQGLDLGADDYVLKPFEMAELLARMRAVARRKGGVAGPLLCNEVLSLDVCARTVALDGQEIHLSAREFALLHALMIRPGAILSRGELEDRMYGWGSEVESNAVEFIIHALRKKLGNDAIKNVRGVGWLVPKTR
ncbi:hypothetical protein M622_07760 [Thauera terpenica 58Eu]|jgi:two-component system OmpR family response regulator|uniref:XRE family transcriptional regulator n=1 Tax=Thauera terpenica 58Eu TaxID=1348657 RepID=T0ALX1_9RHOO|nr:response regulator transcription factor [Thauera terpenica]EPZ13859.1 hypothetical protein M622_07760 [Thauera terpenica 58Eu]MBP6725937.1 response regulator transcription factor [Thauera sp.]MBP6760799.1 response regulator transcription factor [Thauera sp.]